jgi:competence protein ComEA
MEGMNMKIKSLFMAIFIACTLLVGLPVQAGDKVNVNTATVEQLQTVKGIGPKTAAAIVAYREANGSFDNIDELENVKGIGKKKLAGIEDQLSVEKSESSD